MTKNLRCFSLLGLVALSSSCATDLYQSNPVQSSEREISFKTFADKQLRASVTTAGSMTSFTTSAWSHSDGAVSAANPYNGYVLNGVTVTRSEDGSATSWDYFPKASWPARDSVDFFAYSPASSVNVTAGLKKDVTTVPTPPATGPEIEYTVPGWVGGSRPIDQQEDFMVTKSVDLTFASSPTVQLNFKHALSRIVFKAQNQNKNKMYVIKELALSKLKSKGTLNMLDSVPNGADSFTHTAGEYDVAWKAQHDSVTYKVDLGSTNVLVPYGTGTASGDYTAITNASNGLMVLPQETILGAFTGSTPEYGTVAEIDATPADASYLYATVSEVDYLTNDTVNRRQVVFRLHDPANKAQGIVFEAGRQYTFLLTLGLDGEEIAFSIPSVTDFNLDAVDYVPWLCGMHPIKGYTTANYNNPGIEDLCWTTQNIAEGTASYDTYIDDTGTITPAPTKGERGYYYAWSQADAACKELGADWYLPDDTQWAALKAAYASLQPGRYTSGNAALHQSYWNGTLGAGYHIDAAVGAAAGVPEFTGWAGDDAMWWSSTRAGGIYASMSYAGNVLEFGSMSNSDDAVSVRCVRDM
ncbi:hypothetical protein AGMMS49525_07750 [Bacteroidia bacterium]|nr:hypothetical protein AGMMS49525_07750 [Bacteroidia bacterium]